MEMDMTTGRPLPEIAKFTLPLIVGNVFQQLYNMADTIIVGRVVGQGALAAVGSTGTIMFLVSGLSSGLTTGFTVLTSQSYGAGNMKRVKHSVSNAIILSIILSVIVTLISCLTMGPVLRIMNTPEDIYQDAYRYIMIICAGTICSVFYNLFAAQLRAVGNSQVPLFFLVFSAFLNVGLDLLLTAVIRMGTAGAALATIMAQGISAVLCIIYIYKKIPVLKPERTDWHLSRSDTMLQLRIAIPMGLQYGITASGTMIMQGAINMCGSTAVAAYTAACKLQSIFATIFLSVGQAMATYGGQNFGKGDLDRLKKGARETAIAVTGVAIIAGILVLVLLKPSLHLFFSAGTDLTEIHSLARTYLRMSVSCFPALGYIYIYRSIMQGCNYAFLPTAGGGVELLARLICAALAVRHHSYILAVACDPAAWLAAGIFDLVGWLWVVKDIKRRFA